MPDEVVARGAEAVLYRRDGRLVKERIVKEYRISELDSRLRKRRTQREAKILENARRVGALVPRVFGVDAKNSRIVMEFVAGRLVKDAIPNMRDDEIMVLGGDIGRVLALLHQANIVHNDLTTSNMVLGVDGLYLIDFGLGFTSLRVEDKAMDLVVFKKALQATHSSRFELLWDCVIKAYSGYKNSGAVLDRIRVIEKRARYL